MKNTNYFFIAIASLFIFSLTLFANPLAAQNSWIGGTPGSETEWNNPRNWSQNHVPDEYDLVVIIPNVSTQSGFFPTIKNEVPSIGYLNIEGGATVTIVATGKLTINGEATYNHGIQNTGNMVNSGMLTIKNTALSALAEPKNNIENTGLFAVNEVVEDSGYAALVGYK